MFMNPLSLFRRNRSDTLLCGVMTLLFNATCPISMGRCRRCFYRPVPVKFPGRWVPVPWAYHDSITLCQRSGDPDHCNILMERCEGAALSFECHSVAAAATRYSLSQLANVPPDRITLLGQGVDSDELPPLRDGDILHYTVSRATKRGAAHLLWPVVLGALCSFSSRGCVLSTLGFLVTLVDGWAAGRALSTPPEPSRCPPCPRVSSTGVTSAPSQTKPAHPRADRSQCSPPLGLSFSDLAARWWSVSRRCMCDALSRLACYLSAFGAPEWFREPDGWVLDLSSTCRLQALLPPLLVGQGPSVIAFHILSRDPTMLPGAPCRFGLVACPSRSLLLRMAVAFMAVPGPSLCGDTSGAVGTG